jgi:large exoprotein involved in heme utilization and adhesion
LHFKPFSILGHPVSNATKDVVLADSAQFVASTYGQGNAGDVIINATNSVSIDGYVNSNGQLLASGIFSTVGDVDSTQNNIVKGNSGNIQITTEKLSLTNGAQLVTATLGQGNAGNVIINATKSISVDGYQTAIFSTVGAVNNNQNNLAVGNGGNIQITTNQLSLTNGAQFLVNTYGQGNAGNVIINATNSVSMDNHADIFSSVGDVTNTQNNQAIGNGGNIQITTGRLSLANSAQLGTDTFGQGNAGNVIINATNSVSLDGHGDIFSTVGNVNITLDNFIKGNGGNIQITTDQLSLTNGAELLASTYGQGNAGNVIINATNSVSVDGNQTLIFSTAGSADSNAEQNSLAQGKGGSIRITTNQLSLAHHAQFNASTYGQSEAGNIEVASGSISLDQGMITAQTRSGNGGSITLTPKDLLLLRNHSLISTTAGISSANGNGGDITINAPNGFVVATNHDNNDITANAFNGFGGAIQINALGIYNFNQRSLQDLENSLGTHDPTQLDPQKLPTNDITAISLTSPALSGQVNIVTPDIDPTRSLITLPTVTEQTPKLVSSSCAAFNEASGGSQFTITGRGGLPPSPDEPLTTEALWTDTRLPVNTAKQHQSETHLAKPKHRPIAIILATGWVFNNKGEVTLISTATNPTSANTPTSCPVR